MDRLEYELEFLIHSGKWKKVLKLLKSPLSRLNHKISVWVIIIAAEDGIEEFVNEALKSRRLVSYFKLDDFDYLFGITEYQGWDDISDKIIKSVQKKFTLTQIYNKAPKLAIGMGILNVNEINNTNEICSICLENSPNVETMCGHQFHRECLGNWKKRNKTCPMCRKEGTFFGKSY
jgi:hypothetical protein